MTREQRRSFDNGIWLCSNDATEIDANRAAFPPTLLKEWKAEAERRARAERGRRLPEPDDARAEVRAMLTGATPKFTRTAITNTHAAVQQFFKDMDPRLSVDTSFVGGKTHYGILAREEVKLQIRFPAHLADQWRSGMRDLADHGREIQLPAAGLQVTGSPVFDLLLDTNSLVDAQFIIGPSSKKKAVQKLRLTDPVSGATVQFDDINGCITSGRKSGTFEGNACGGALATSLTLELGEGRSPWKATFVLTLQFDCWEGVDVQVLPYFEKLQSLIEHIRAGWQFEVELEVDGRSMGRARASLNDLSAFLISDESQHRSP